MNTLIRQLYSKQKRGNSQNFLQSWRKDNFPPFYHFTCQLHFLVNNFLAAVDRRLSCGEHSVG